MPFTLVLALLSTLANYGLAGDTKQCYQPNGASVSTTGGSLQIALHACPAGVDGFATCCAEGDTCSPDRLCYNAGGGNVWRNFCTDPTWKSVSCSPMCRGTSQWDSGPVQVTPCPDGTMCCGQNNTECCQNKQGSYAFQGVPINATSSNSGSNKLSGGSIAGIVIGVIAVVVLIALAILLALKIRDDRRRNRHEPKQDVQDLRERRIPESTANVSIHPAASARSHEISHKPTTGFPSGVQELGGGQGVSRFEVRGDTVFGEEKK